MSDLTPFQEYAQAFKRQGLAVQGCTLENPDSIRELEEAHEAATVAATNLYESLMRRKAQA